MASANELQTVLREVQNLRGDQKKLEKALRDANSPAYEIPGLGGSGRGIKQHSDGSMTPIGQRWSFDQFQDQRASVPLLRAALQPALLESVNMPDVGMIEYRKQLGFACEAREPLGIRCK